MLLAAIFTIAGYLSGSVLYARVFARALGRSAVFPNGEYRNPGTVSAFKYGGVGCGMLTVVADLAKGALPVILYCYLAGPGARASWLVAPVLLAPVLGHLFPLYFRLRGGKAIAVCFGVLIGLLPDWQPLCALAVIYIGLSLVLCIPSTFYRSIVSYLASPFLMWGLGVCTPILGAFCVIAVLIILRFWLSPEQRGHFSVKLFGLAQVLPPTLHPGH
ncbi:MAG: glycerol-3-phosphate acyltransferase [Coriobacteriales bacterium]|jgi:glycerol-3-phosphate acyltransferase PlsY|nr:glycerol-3-phosphate acyltransferase [Coriobacteriales bacterium]